MFPEAIDNDSLYTASNPGGAGSKSFAGGVLRSSNVLNSTIVLTCAADESANTFTINGTDKYLYADTNEAEVSTTRMDFLSNGFKLRSNHDVWNGSGRTNLYMAFAESPFVNSSGVPNNAR